MRMFLFIMLLFASTIANAKVMPSLMYDDCNSGKIDRVKPWVDKGFVNTVRLGNTCLILSAYKDHTDLGIYLLKSGADVNLFGPYDGVPALAIATYRNNYQLIEAMLQHGGDAWIEYRYSPPWTLFVKNDDVRALEIYLSNGWDPASRLDSVNPLEFAARRNALKVAKELSKNESLLNGTVTFNGYSVLSSAPLAGAIESRNSQMAHLLLQAGAVPNSVSFKSRAYNEMYANTVLGAAAQRGMTDVTRALIQAGAYVNIPEKTQDIYYYLENPLCSAAVGSALNNSEVSLTIKLLLQAKANIEVCRSPWNQQPIYIPTPLYRAISWGMENVIALVEGGADVNAVWQVPDDYYKVTWTPLSFAIAHEIHDVAEYLKLHGAK
ncbi:MAG: hypothetical protein JNM39_02390 [Bdellovibrionaceae bacterium]|nr:hypothetical protein [Pseudobdellovibrionaceae bacterium]